MAKSSGSIYTNYVGTARYRMDWYIDYNNNRISYNVYMENSAGSGYYRKVWFCAVWIYGREVTKEYPQSNYYDGDWICGGSIPIEASGSAMGVYGGIGSNSDNASGEVYEDFALYAYFSNQPTLKARTNLSADVYFKPDRNLSATQWRLFINNAWTEWRDIGVGGQMVDGSWNGRRGISYYK